MGQREEEGDDVRPSESDGARAGGDRFRWPPKAVDVAQADAAALARAARIAHDERFRGGRSRGEQTHTASPIAEPGAGDGVRPTRARAADADERDGDGSGPREPEPEHAHEQRHELRHDGRGSAGHDHDLHAGQSAERTGDEDAEVEVWRDFERGWLGVTREPWRVRRREARLDGAGDVVCSGCASGVRGAAAEPDDGGGEVGVGAGAGIGAVGGGVARCRGCEAGVAWSRAVRLGPYEGELRAVIHDIKFASFRTLGAAVGAEVGARVADAYVMSRRERRAKCTREEGVDGGARAGVSDGADGREGGEAVVFVPVPMPWARRARRGIDHARVLGCAACRGFRGRMVESDGEDAEGFGGRLPRAVVCVRGLSRRHRPSQVDVTDGERARNAAGSVVVSPMVRLVARVVGASGGRASRRGGTGGGGGVKSAKGVGGRMRRVLGRCAWMVLGAWLGRAARDALAGGLRGGTGGVRRRGGGAAGTAGAATVVVVDDVRTTGATLAATCLGVRRLSRAVSRVAAVAGVVEAGGSGRGRGRGRGREAEVSVWVATIAVADHGQGPAAG